MKRKLKNFLSLTLITTVLLGSSLSANAAPVMMPDGTFFDAEYYAQTNPDVVGVLGTDATVLYNHYVNNGKAEGRAPYNPAIDISSLADTATYAASIDATLRDTDSSYLELKTALPGSYITFGTYEQDNNKKNGQEPIEWLVLENDGESLFVLSKYVLDGQPYSTALDQTPITWENCYLRTWLNSSFLATAFIEGEQARINTTYVENNLPSSYNPKSPFNDANLTAGNDTLDKIYILSYDEVKQYFPMKDSYYGGRYYYNYDILLRATATPYALAQGVDIWTAKDAATCLSYGGGYKNIANDVIGYVEKWALRSPSYSQGIIYNIGASGGFGNRPATYDNATRPCMRISIK